MILMECRKKFAIPDIQEPEPCNLGTSNFKTKKYLFLISFYWLVITKNDW